MEPMTAQARAKELVDWANATLEDVNLDAATQDYFERRITAALEAAALEAYERCEKFAEAQEGQAHFSYSDSEADENMGRGYDSAVSDITAGIRALKAGTP